MNPAEFLELQEAITELTELAPIEPFPVEALPVRTVTWFSRLMIIFSRHAILLAFLGAMVENTILLGFLLPGGAMVALAAAGAREANLPLPLIVFFAGVGMTVGATVDYLLGQAGIDRLLHHRWTGRWGKRASQELQQATPLLSKHGWWVMLIAHAFGHGRSALAVAAGASRFGLRRFLAIEFPAALLWSAIYAGGGYLLAHQWHAFEVVIRRAGWVGASVLVLSVVAFLIWRRYQDAQRR
ncbi:MAG TPA: DedA family protein, partial [Chloroflexota bacterium]|nr:DedA family protein [Chloroflexota bacterium]